jgi:hypothetical protein
MVATSGCIVDETTITIIVIDMEAVATVATASTTTDGTPISMVYVVDMEMVMAMVIVCLLFNLMMNVEFTVDTSGTSVISAHEDSDASAYGSRGSGCGDGAHRPAGKQYAIPNGEHHSSQAVAQRTLSHGRASGMDAGWNGPDGPPPHLIGRPSQCW